MREGDEHDGNVPEPQGRFAGFPYDWRRPTRARFKARFWNPHDRRVLTPHAFGWGLTVNWYWVAHPARLVRTRLRSG